MSSCALKNVANGMGGALARANHAGSIKRIHDYTQNVNFANATIEEVEVRLARLEKVWSQFDTENDAVLLNLTSTDEDNEKLYEEIEELYMKAKVTLKKKVNELAKASASAHTPAVMVVVTIRVGI